MKWFKGLLLISLAFTATAFADQKIEDDCEKAVVEKFPKAASCKKQFNADKNADRPKRIDCYLKYVEANLHGCLRLNYAKERNDCIVDETVKITKLYPKECTEYFKADINNRIETKEKEKFGGKSSFEVNAEKLKAHAEAKAKTKNAPPKKDANVP